MLWRRWRAGWPSRYPPIIGIERNPCTFFIRVREIAMKMYLLSLGAGILVGVIYAVLNVRSPAPPIIALVGLLGILLGEQAVPLVKRILSPEPVNAAWLKQECGQHLFGELPGASPSKPPTDRHS
jgi:XapX domain-containing protein